jgi:hypothetical protein
MIDRRVASALILALIFE